MDVSPKYTIVSHPVYMCIVYVYVKINNTPVPYTICRVVGANHYIKNYIELHIVAFLLGRVKFVTTDERCRDIMNTWQYFSLPFSVSYLL